MTNGDDSNGAGDGGDFDDDSDATVVEAYSGPIIARLGRVLCETAIDVGRYGNSLGSLSADVDGNGDPGRESERLNKAHATGCNAARSLRDLLEHLGAANELLRKAAQHARIRAKLRKA
jgi:hypothetical protein